VHRETFTGDWGGARPGLTDCGLTFGGRYIADGSAVVSGGLGRTAVARGLVSLDLTADLVGLAGGTVYVQYLARHGPEVSGTAGVIQAASNIDAEPFNRFGEVWVEQAVAKGRVRLKLGRVDANAEFAGLDAAGGFLNASAGYSPTITFMPTYAAPVLSANVFVQPTTWLTLGAGVYDDDFSLGWTAAPSGSGPFWIGEMRLPWAAGQAGAGRWWQRMEMRL
jgi:carbohydrate-selective porin OprB